MRLVLKHLLPFFPLTALFAVSIGSFGYYVQERNKAAQPVLSQLEQAAGLKQKQLHRWFKDQKNMLLTDAKSKKLVTSAQVVLTTRIKSKPTYKKAYQTLKTYFESQHGKSTSARYRSASLLTNGGIVIFSTDPKRESEYQPLQNTTTYFEPQDVDRVVPTFYVSTTTEVPSITLATPIFDTNGRRIGALAVDLDLDALNHLIRSPIEVLEERKNYLYSTGKTYLVGSLSSVSGIRNGLIGSADSQENSLNIVSDGIRLAMQQEAITGMFLNYLKQPVLGSYIKYQNLVLVAEVRQSEIFDKIHKQVRDMFLIGITIVLIISAIILFLENKSEIFISTDSGLNLDPSINPSTKS
jgi:hypothetical protein